MTEGWIIPPTLCMLSICVCDIASSQGEFSGKCNSPSSFGRGGDNGGGWCGPNHRLQLNVWEGLFLLVFSHRMERYVEVERSRPPHLPECVIISVHLRTVEWMGEDCSRACSPGNLPEGVRMQLSCCSNSLIRLKHYPSISFIYEACILNSILNSSSTR